MIKHYCPLCRSDKIEIETDKGTQKLNELNIVPYGKCTCQDCKINFDNF